MRNIKLEAKHIILIILLLLAILLAAFSYLISDDRKLTPVEEIIKDTVVTIQKTVYYPFRYIDSKIDMYKDLKKVYKENKSLKEDISKYNLLKSENKTLKRELEYLKNILELETTLSEYDYLHATVVNRNVGYWYNTITINKGSHHGVEKDMAVINNNGLIGKVIKTTNFTSEIKLITTNDTTSKISVGIENDDNIIHGLLEGYDSTNNLLIVEGITTNEFEKGDSVVTTGLGGIFPAGILVGYVEGTVNDEYGLTKNIRIRSEVDFNNIYFVTILRRRSN
ncbi:MAG: rod shape-determining protein MreC [Bacilli bacterium]|nr:rod shape-determining protein MreC [Bacilli bacterium]